MIYYIYVVKKTKAGNCLNFDSINHSCSANFVWFVRDEKEINGLTHFSFFNLYFVYCTSKQKKSKVNREEKYEFCIGLRLPEVITIILYEMQKKLIDGFSHLFKL